MEGIVGDSPTVVNRPNEYIFALSPTSPVVTMHATVESQFTRKTLYILRENIRSLLIARKEDQVALARWCGHDKSWLNKFLNEGRGIRLADLDRIGAFFGVEAYQLLQPGISRLTERRSDVERRTNTDRRIGHTGRLVRALQSEVNKVPRLAAPSRGSVRGAVSDSKAAARETLIRDFERRLAAIDRAHPDEIAGIGRDRSAVASHRGRKAGGAHPHPSKKAAGEA